MDYEILLYACVQKADDIEFPDIHTDKNIEWFGGACRIDQEEFSRYFPDGVLTADGMTQLVAHWATHKELI
mgnify:CR=1 FL=1